MPEPFHIRPAWPDTMVYVHEDGRELSLPCRTMEEPPQVLLPVPARWASEVEPWAGPLRASIAARLRTAGCLVVDEDGDTYDRTLGMDSPDGTLRVEQQLSFDDRSGPWESTCLYALPQRTPLMRHSHRPATQPPRFPAPGQAVLHLFDRGGQERRVEVDAAGRRFRLDAGTGPLARLAASTATDADWRPLQDLQQALGMDLPIRGYTPPPAAATALARVIDAVVNVGGWILAAGGVWMVFTAETTKDRWIGAAAALFFGAGIVVPLWNRWGPRRWPPGERVRDDHEP